VVCIGALFRSYLNERHEKRQIQNLIQLRRFGLWPPDAAMLSMPDSMCAKEKIPRGCKN
jgi:hypothetical protein